MTRKKRGFWTFCFSLIPGAGEMYLGFMKRGLSMMCLFLCGFDKCWFRFFPKLVFPRYGEDGQDVIV